jgi:hypothetical protein
MKVFLPLHESKHLLFVLYDTKILKIDQILSELNIKQIHSLFKNTN